MESLDSHALDPCPGHPLAIAFSGGGDSTALVYLMRNRRPRPYVYIVDHALRENSDLEAMRAWRFASDLGLQTQILKWNHDNPTTGLQEKARMARYGLLGAACRKRHISHLLTAHTKDDQAETLLMRRDRQTDWRGAAGMKSRVYAPIWPELAEIILHRPLLGHSRNDLRDYNRSHDLSWSEDPSNDNRQFKRIQARDTLKTSPGLRRELLTSADAMQEKREIERLEYKQIIEDHITIDPHGYMKFQSQIPHQLLGQLLRVASGTGGPITLKKRETLQAKLSKPNFKSATLAGGRIIKDSKSYVIGPDPSLITGRSGRPALKAQRWPARRRFLWNGRFWIETQALHMIVQPLAGKIAQLPPKIAEQLRFVPAPFRGALPLMTNVDDELSALGVITQRPGIQISCAVAPRLQGMFAQPEFLRH